MLQALKKPSIPQSCDSGFDERHLLCCLYDELGSWRLSNHSSFCTEKAGLEDSACTKAYRTSFAGLSSAIAKADAAWDQAATNFTSTASVATVTTPLSEYTLPLSLASCTKYLNSTKAAVLSADEDDQSICQLAGLPRLHASSFEVICITGLCTAAQTDIDWESIKEHTYIQAVRFLAGYDTAWLLQIAHDRHHAQCEILQLEAHVHLIGKPCLLMQCIIASLHSQFARSVCS